MATPELDVTWKSAFPDRSRPVTYTGKDVDDDGFRPLADPSEFLTDIPRLTAAQLYAQAANNQLALQQTQDEYLELERIINQLKSRDSTITTSTKHPQAFAPYPEYEERKESILYGYKYDSNRPLASYGRWQDVTDQERRDLRSYQDPFSQGGFVPNDRQYRGLLNKAKDKRNLDGWTPVEERGKKLIPKMAPRVNEKEEYWQLSGLLPTAKNTLSKPVTRSGTPDFEAVGPSGRETPVNKRLRNTRFNGAKVPLTRDVSEAPSLPHSRASTPKRKRGDTPVLLFDQNDSPVKKPRLTVPNADATLPPRRKHHNQYTKAKENAALEAMAAQKATADRAIKLEVPPAVHSSLQTITVGHDSYSWSGLTDQEKRDFHWNNDTLLLAVREDPTWLNEDPKTRHKWTRKILESKYPVRTYSMYKKWDYWRLIGEDKRPRNKKKSSGLDDDDADMDEASEMVTATPSPRSRSFNTQELDDLDELVQDRALTAMRPSRLGQSDAIMHGYSEDGDLRDNGTETMGEDSQRASSDSVSQTISVNREDVPSPLRRVTRASRVVSS